MRDPAPTPTGKHRRSHWIVDPSMQLGAVFTVVGIGGGGLLFGVIARLWSARAITGGLASDEAGQLALAADVLFVALALVFVGVYVVWLTHRFAGPARVLRHALDGIAVGDLTRRTRLRKRDFLKDVAASIDRVAQSVRSDREAVAVLIDALTVALDRGDAAAAREALRRYEARDRVAGAAVGSSSELPAEEPVEPVPVS